MGQLEQRITVIEDAIKMAGLATKEVLNFDEAALFAGFSKSHLYKLTSGGKIPHYKPMGKMCYFNRGELEVWLQQNRVSTNDEIESQAAAFCMKPQKRIKND